MKQFQQILKDRGYYTGNIDGIVGPLTLGGAKQWIDAEMDQRGWVKPVTDLVWIRTDQTFDNKFADYVVRFNNRVADMIMTCSTTPGDYIVFNPLTVGGITGSAVACEQQVIGSHKFVTAPDWKHLWLNAPYFYQAGAIEIWRDANKDRKLDKNVKTKGWYGINFHRGGIGHAVDNWSAGCLVVPDRIWYQAIKIFKPNQLINFTLIEL
tara:strand:- start:4736 stop:5362 length:627 start_codon:yes stop_codon:yes gene_type:complete